MGARCSARSARNSSAASAARRSTAARLNLKIGNRDVSGLDFRGSPPPTSRRARRRPTRSCSSGWSGGTSTASPANCGAADGSVTSGAGGVAGARDAARRRRPICATGCASSRRDDRRTQSRARDNCGCPSGARSAGARRMTRRAPSGSPSSPPPPPSCRPSSSARRRRLAQMRERARGREAGARDRRRHARRQVAVGAIVRAIRPNRMGVLGKLGLYLSRAWRVRRRRSARVQHRGRHLPGDLRHRDDGAPDGDRSSRRSACWRRSTCANTPSRGRWCGWCASRSTTSPACRRSSSASSAWASSSTCWAARSIACSSPTRCRRRPSAPAASCGPR